MIPDPLSHSTVSQSTIDGLENIILPTQKIPFIEGEAGVIFMRRLKLSMRYTV